MAVELAFAPAAKEDISQAYAWYEDQRAGLGEEFLNCLEACLELILKSPMIFPVAYKDYRRALTRRFPYAVFYKTEGGSQKVFGVLHTSRGPAKIHDRLL